MIKGANIAGAILCNICRLCTGNEKVTFILYKSLVFGENTLRNAVLFILVSELVEQHLLSQ